MSAKTTVHGQPLTSYQMGLMDKDKINLKWWVLNFNQSKDQ